MESVIHAQRPLHIYTYIHTYTPHQLQSQRNIPEDVTSLHLPETLFPALLRTKQNTKKKCNPRKCREPSHLSRACLTARLAASGRATPKKVKYIKRSGLAFRFTIATNTSDSREGNERAQKKKVCVLLAARAACTHARTHPPSSLSQSS